MPRGGVRLLEPLAQRGRARASLSVDADAVTVIPQGGGKTCAAEPSTTLPRDEAVGARPVGAAGWARLFGAADVAVGLRDGGEVRLGLAARRREAEWMAAEVTALWLQTGGAGVTGRSAGSEETLPSLSWPALD